MTTKRYAPVDKCMLFGGGGRVHIWRHIKGSRILPRRTKRPPRPRLILLTEHRPQVSRGPEAHVVGCTVEDEVFVATSAAPFHSAHLGRRSEVRINGVVDAMSRLNAGNIVPIGWVVVGNSRQILPPSEHKRIWRFRSRWTFRFCLRISSVRTQRCGTLLVEFRLSSHISDKPSV